MLLEVDEGQRGFVASNAWSLAQWHFNPQFVPWAIYADEEMIGFMMYEFEEDENDVGSLDCWFFRFMIDKRQQRKGYGREAFRLFLEKIEEEPPERFQRMGLSLEAENNAAIRFHEGFGFRNTGKKLGNELIFAKDRNPADISGESG